MSERRAQKAAECEGVCGRVTVLFVRTGKHNLRAACCGAEACVKAVHQTARVLDEGMAADKAAGRVFW